MNFVPIPTPPKIINKKGLQAYKFDGCRYNLYDFPEFNDNTEKPFFLFVSNGKVIAAAHLNYEELDGSGAAADRFYTKHGVSERQMIYCFDPLLKWR